MRSIPLVAAVIVALAFVGFVGLRFWQYSRLWPKPSSEVVQLTPAKRAALQDLKAEEKFGPYFPPVGFAGSTKPKNRAIGTAAVNGVIDAVLANRNGPVGAKAISALIGHAMREVDRLDTEDRDRTRGYLLEIWYLLGFRGATGLFAYGSAFPKPPGYAEPLPAGWTAPDRPRNIGHADLEKVAPN